MKIKAFQISDSIDVKTFKKEYTGVLHSYSTSDLFYVTENNGYFYVLSFGVAVFAGYDDLKISENIAFLKKFATDLVEQDLNEELIVNLNSTENHFGHTEVSLTHFSADIMKIIMLNIGQSVALDYYLQQATAMLEETNRYTRMLEEKGKLAISNKKLMQFIGKTLNVNNKIYDQLYIIDQPEAAWNDEYISKVDKGMRRVFDIDTRFKNIEYYLNMIKGNLELFKNLMQHNTSNKLEIIIIVLILIEVANLFVEKIF